MVYQSKSSITAKRYAAAKQRIRKGQRRAKRIGFLYLIAMTLFLAASLIPFASFVGVKLGTLNVLVGGTPLRANAYLTLAIEIAVAVITFVYLLKGLTKIKWLCKKKASKTYGFNRPMYAMDDIARYFAFSFAAVIAGYMVLAALTKASIGVVGYIILGAGLLFHFLGGFATFKLCLFDAEDGFLGQKREYRTFGSILRNVAQLTVCGLMAWAFLASGVIYEAAYALYANFNAYLANPMAALMPVLVLATLVIWVFMVKYAVSGVEYDIEARKARGRKTFLWLSLLAALVMGGAVVYAQLSGNPMPWMKAMLGYATIGAFVAELLFIALPGKIKPKKAVKKESDDVDAHAYIKNAYNQPSAHMNNK